MRQPVDTAVIGAGASGLATAIFVARRMPDRSVVVLDGARKVGQKILVSGGGRCNITNRHVTSTDYYGGSRNVIKRVLAAFNVDETIAFFNEIGVALHEEEDGKLFPNSNKARTVLHALLNEADRLGVRILTAHRVTHIRARDGDFDVLTPTGALRARYVVLATGGKSLPKTGSDGGGYALARSLGHSLIEPAPALVPLVLKGESNRGLAGVSHDAELVLRTAGSKPLRIRGPLLWTHFGVSGPAVLDVSRHWQRARLEGGAATITLNALLNEDFTSADAKLVAATSSQPRRLFRNVLSEWLPARLIDVVLARMGVEGQTRMSQLSRDVRRKVLHALLEWPLPVVDTRGYAFAEVTSGGVPLGEIAPDTMESRRCPGLYLAGEILDVDGRVGGYNFQWAWSSAWLAAAGIAKRYQRRLPQTPGPSCKGDLP